MNFILFVTNGMYLHEHFYDYQWNTTTFICCTLYTKSESLPNLAKCLVFIQFYTLAKFDVE